MPTYTIEISPSEYADECRLKIGFGDEPASNDQIVQDVEKRLGELNLCGGQLCLLNGPASLPVAMVLAHRLAHRFGAIGVWDPKLQKYVIAISHDPDRAVGDLY